MTIKIKPEEFNFISKYIYEISGIALTEEKTYLIETRLSDLVEKYSCKSYSELCKNAKSDFSKSVEKQIIDSITTNETLFFRDFSPFELLKHKLLPDYIDKKAKASNVLPIECKVWSAACSTGQEIYSIAMIIRELFPEMVKLNIKINFKLLATDISDSIISQASQGRYNRFEIERGLPKKLLDKYFTSDSNSWKIKDKIRAMIEFKRQNLMRPFASLGKFDFIFCRNVAIYFSVKDRKSLFDNVANALQPDGYLIIGSTESLSSICPKLESNRHLRSVFYKLK